MSLFDRGKLGIVEFAVEAVFLHQLFVIALFDDLSLIHDQDLIGIADRRKTMGNDERSPTLHQGIESLLYLQLGTRIDGRSRLIQYQHRRHLQHDPRDT